MCAITGILKRDGGPADGAVIARMTGQLEHRGPDGDGIALRGPVAFGHRRLSIIDLEGGQQPMFNEDGNVWVTFNGEIYNYRELTEHLKSRGHCFRTRSDTEVIVHAWEEWGEQCVERLRGMFAFAVMDWTSGQLFLARDHLGIKPLHYLETPDYFAFASEPQALRHVPGFNGELSFDALDQFLWLQYIPAPQSIYDQAAKLAPAHCLTVNLSGDVPQPKEYWRVGFEPDESLSAAEWTEAIHAAVDDSVRAHLVSDVPFGAFLSGGVDSSLVVARMSETLGQPVRAFSIGFEEADFDETGHAATAARRCGADHHVEIVRPDALGILPRLVQHYGEPFGDSSAVPTFYVSELARREVPMVLSGDGADELFAGYWSHGHYLDFCQANPGAAPALPHWLQFIQYTDPPTRQNLWRPEWRAHSPARLDAFTREWDRAAGWSPAHRAQYLDLKTYLPYDILTKVDIASMAHGLEVRTPFVDVRVAELAMRIPDRLNIHPGGNGEWERKCLLRQVAARYFGDEFVNRPKMGFAMPFAKWVAPGGRLHDAVTRKLLGSESTVLPLFNPDLIRQFLGQGAFGPLWLLLFLEEWLRYHESAPRWREESAPPNLNISEAETVSSPASPDEAAPPPPQPMPSRQAPGSMRIRSVSTVSEFQRVLDLPQDGRLLEDDLDVVDTDCDLHSRKRRDAEVLCTLAANVRGNCLDLGTSHGRSAFKLGTNLAPGFKVFTVNILPEQFDDASGKLITHLLSRDDIGCYYRQAGLQNIEQHYADTAKWDIPEEIDQLAMVFVDAAHDEELVYSDSKRVYDRIAPGGYICWHDFCPELRSRHHWIDDCMRGVERFLAEYGLEETEIVHLKDSWVAVLRKPEAKPGRVTAVSGAPKFWEQDLRQLRYVCVYPNYDEERAWEEKARIERIRSWGYNAIAFPIDCPGGWWHFPQLDAAWKQRDPFLLSQYDQLREALTDRDVLISSGGSMLHPEFIAELDVYTVFTCSDDPESSEVLSRPAAPAFDFSFCLNVACLDDYRRWGCRRVGWFYHAPDPASVWPGLTEEKILTGERDIDIALLCERVFNLSDRGERVERLVKEFPNAFVRGRGWPGGHVAPAPVYARTKIGWNLHNSIGPCNSRLVTLPANGILQICDNRSQLGKLFKLDEEIVGFETIEECIDKTRHYLAHDEERRQIAAAGWRRVQLDYTEQKQWEFMLEQIREDYFQRQAGAPADSAPSTLSIVAGSSDESAASAPVQLTTKPLRPELELDPMKVFTALEKNNAPSWFRQVFEERASRWDVWQPCFWIAQNMSIDSSVLSVGSGAGYNLFWLGEHGFTDLTGIDVDKLVVAAANDIAQQSGIPAQFNVDDGIRPRTLGERKFDVIEALNWTMSIDGFCLADFLDEYLPRLRDDGVLIVDAIDESYDLVPGNEFLTSDLNRPVPERRPSEYRTRASEKQLRALLEVRGYDVVQVFAEEQRVPRKVYVIGRAEVGHRSPAPVTPPPTCAPKMFNQTAAVAERRKPRIHLIADVADWIFARHCDVISKGLGEEFEFDLGLQGQPYNEDDYDLIYPLEWNLVTPEQIRNPAKYVTGIRSHTSWKDHDFDRFTNYLREHFGIVHVVSERLRQIFAPALPDVRHLTHGIDPLFFQCRQPVNDTDRKLRIGWAGNRVNPTKGFEQLIQPLGELPDVELVYCGYLDRKLELPEMREFYDSIDVYICSSELEGNNNSLLEAAAMERALITTDSGAVPEYLVDGENALIVERQPEAFVAAVERLRDDPKLRARLGRAARPAVVTKFDWRSLLEQHRAIFREALGQRSEDPLVQAEANVRKALALQPYSIDAMRLLHQILRERGKWAAAARVGQDVLQHEPDDINTLLGLAKCCFETNDVEAARTSLERVLELDPDNDLARQNLADLDRTEISLRPDIEESIRLGIEAIQQERLPDALTHYRKALNLGLQNEEIEQLVGQLEDALGPQATKSGWSFCVITNGQKPQELKETLDSIRALDFPVKEILVGGEPPEDLGDDVTIVPVVDAARNGRLGEMRNRLVAHARHDHLVVCDDDMLFHEDFAAGMEEYGDDWEVLCVRLLNPDGTRFWDWATHGGPRGHCLLKYDETDPHVYVTGGLCLIKSFVAERVKWDENRGFYEEEDIDFSSRLREAGISIKFNRHSTVTHNDCRYTQIGTVLIRQADLELGELEPEEPKPTLPVRWLGPIFNPSGYASEAIDFLLPLADRLEIGLRHQSTLYSEKFVEGLAPDVRGKLFQMREKFGKLRGGISIAHNPANGFVRPDDADYCIGRTMFETDQISPAWVAACNQMDEVWVPSKFNVETFARSGVERDKLVVMPGAVDTDYFDPSRHEALPLPNRAAFNFLAIFEWSTRKAWDVLIAAYLREFSAEDDVCLYLRTYQFGRPDGDPSEAIWREIQDFAATLNLGDKEWPRIELLTEQVAAPDLPKLYRAADCLVGISRGEGWGRPHHEAMSMALPVIATNWSGNTEFMTTDTACLIDGVLVEAKALEPELWHYKGHNWVNPSESQLRVSLRRMQIDPDAARSLGQRARAHIVQNFSRESVAEKVVARLLEIERKLTTPALPPAGRQQPSAEPANGEQTSFIPFDTILNVAWEGSYVDFGSLSHVNRELTRQLSQQPGIKLTRVGKNALPPNADKSLREIARQLKARARNNTQVTIRHNWPPDWTESAADLRIHCQPWEYGVLPADWVAQVEQVDQVWAYTEYVRRVYIDSGVAPDKVKVVPLGIDPELFQPAVQPMELATRKSFKFLFVGGTIHRKGVDVLLQAYLKAFDIEDDVCLVIKDFGGSSVYQGQTMTEQIQAAQTQANAPEILYLDCELGEDEIPGLYTACDCLVHPYRGEGFGLPVLEAMACGLPAIVTGGGATDDFANDDVAWRLPATRSRLGNEVGGLRLNGNGWLLEPDVDALKHALCDAATQPEVVRSKGRAASDYVRSEWTWELSAEKAAACVHEAWRSQQQHADQLAERRSRVGTIELPEVARLGELSGATDLLQAGRHREAWQATLDAMTVRPFHPEAWLTLARIAADAGDVATAKSCIATAQKIAPRYGRARKFAKSLNKKRGAKRGDWPAIPEAGNRLSVIMITKNEERFLDACLASVKDVADQLVVVDTGSTDRTQEIAKQHGAELHEFTWVGDFSAARNEALTHARGDWVLFIDADEELTPEGATQLREAMQRDDTLAWRLPIIDVGREHLGCSHVPRLFRNAPGLFFVGRIHEQVSSSVEARRAEWGLKNGLGEATLRHHGYQEDIVSDRNKIARNLRLLEQAIEEFPNDANLLMNFGLELAKAGQTHAALEQYAEAFAVFGLQPAEARTPELREALVTQYATQLLAHGKNAEAIDVLESPIARAVPLTASQEFLLGLAQLNRGEHKAAAKHFQSCLKKRHEPALTPVSPHIVKGGPDHCLALCFAKLDDPKAERHFAGARDQDPTSIPLNIDFARYLAAQGKPVLGIELLHRVIGESDEHLAVWQAGGDIALANPGMLEFAKDWTAEANRFFPSDPMILRQRAEALLLAGECAEALPLWESLLSRGGANAIAAALVCLVATGREVSCPEAIEQQVSDAFIGWYRRLLECGNETLVEQINAAVPQLATPLPFAAKVLRSAFDEAIAS